MTLEEYNKKADLRRAVAIKHLEHGVDFEDIDSVYIDDTVTIEAGAWIGPCVTLKGNTHISKGAKIYQNSRIHKEKKLYVKTRL